MQPQTPKRKAETEAAALAAKRRRLSPQAGKVMFKPTDEQVQKYWILRELLFKELAFLISDTAAHRAALEALLPDPEKVLFKGSYDADGAQAGLRDLVTLSEQFGFDVWGLVNSGLMRNPEVLPQLFARMRTDLKPPQPEPRGLAEYLAIEELVLAGLQVLAGPNRTGTWAILQCAPAGHGTWPWSNFDPAKGTPVTIRQAVIPYANLFDAYLTEVLPQILLEGNGHGDEAVLRQWTFSNHQINLVMPYQTSDHEALNRDIAQAFELAAGSGVVRQMLEEFRVSCTLQIDVPHGRFRWTSGIQGIFELPPSMLMTRLIAAVELVEPIDEDD
jgi:hypothetical protein